MEKKSIDFSAKTTGLRTTFRSLQYRNYRLFFAGQSVSLIGTWIQRYCDAMAGLRSYKIRFSFGRCGFYRADSNFPLISICRCVHMSDKTTNQYNANLNRVVGTISPLVDPIKSQLKSTAISTNLIDVIQKLIVKRMTAYCGTIANDDEFLPGTRHSNVHSSDIG